MGAMRKKILVKAGRRKVSGHGYGGQNTLARHTGPNNCCTGARASSLSIVIKGRRAPGEHGR